MAKSKYELALPIAGAMLGFVLFVTYVVIFGFAGEYRSHQHSERLAGRVINLVGPELAAGDVDGARTIVEGLAPDGAILYGPDGSVLAGSLPEKGGRRTKTYPLVADGEVVGRLKLERLAPGGLHFSLTFLAASTILVTLLAFLVTNGFARIMARQTEEIGDLVDGLVHGKTTTTPSEPILFQEFRRLRAQIAKAFSRLQKENRRLAQAAYTDERTGLGNAVKLTQDLTEFISRSNFNQPAAFILLDADNIQHVADTMGMSASHEIHSALARRLAGFVGGLEKDFSMPRDSWPVYALSSDEFAILIDRIGTRQEVMKFVRKALDALRRPYTISGQTVKLTLSAGIVMLPEDGQTPQEIRKRAGSALFQARRTEHADFQFYSPKLDRQNAARKRLEAEVRAAVENKRFIPVFQPKVDLQTGKIIGAEALARWKLESGRIVSPNVFIPVAEATGLIREIGMQVTWQACQAAAQWYREGFKDIAVAVNVSPLQFDSDDLGTDIINAMSEAGLPPRLLQLEITESVAVTDPERLKDVIGPLKTMGVKLAIDDFGTGHSNLAMLGRLPFDVFKIDRSFISSLYSDKQAPAIVEMILGMAETLGMETVAEGVETETQRNFLARRGCQQYQGFLYSKPVSRERFIEMLHQDGQIEASRAG